MNIILRPLNKNAWPGIIKYKNCYEDIKSYWTRSGRRYTGLDEAAAERLGKKLGIDLSIGSEYWVDFFIRTFGKDMYLNIADPMDEVRYLFLMNHKHVKNSLLEHKATAKFVLINKEEEAKRENTMNEAKLEAMTEFTKLTPNEMRKCLRLYGRNATSLSDQIVKNRLFAIVEGNPAGFLQRWVNNEQRETEYILEAALAANIIRRTNNLYKYGGDIIGHSLGEAIEFLDNPKNQDIKIVISKQIEAKSFVEPQEPEQEEIAKEGVKLEGEIAEEVNYEEAPDEIKEDIVRSTKNKKIRETI